MTVPSAYLPPSLDFLGPAMDGIWEHLTPTVVAVTLAVVVVVDVGLLYLLLLLVTHTPRPETASEKTYITADAKGRVPSPAPLPDTLNENVEPEVYMSVVVPAYNEALRIEGMLDEAVDFLREEYPVQSAGGAAGIVATAGVKERKKANGHANGHVNGHVGGGDGEPTGWEILIVDDGSKDETTDVVVNWMTKRVAAGQMKPGDLRVVHLEKNRGKGGAVAHGMRHIRGKYAVFADADGATKFSDLRTLLARLKSIETTTPSPTDPSKKEYHGISVGSRAHMVNSSAVVERRWYRNLLMYAFHTFLHVIGIQKIKDTQCGFKLFTRDTARLVFWECHCEGWIFDIECLLIAEEEKVGVEEVAVTWHEVEGTKMSLIKDSLRMAWDLVVVRSAYIIGVYGGQRKAWRKGKKGVKRL
ncbi:hypothetical protein H072_7813 [Dactylellina haptotyla CBS 200.50]|uniref:dolichyl-phosphate beta-glucosyltransferase n=1 Tax=Dactylellina haptotyla (strain CBS 200.50) TaxID=1284197 RepID=S8ABF8_DACHA|nr:hypothetical protein H072_7813 [Dactylellina haptotyla CBS 200.50]